MHLFAVLLLGGTLLGQVELNGAAPQLRSDTPEFDETACGTDPITDKLSVVGDSGALPYVVITLQPMGKNLRMKSRVPDEIEVDQAGCEFTPFIVVARPDSKVVVRNSDPTLHNVHVKKERTSLKNVAQPQGASVLEIPLEGKGPIRLECDLHYWMKGWVYVTKEPLATVTSNEGTFTFDDIPEGKYMLTAWHPSFGRSRKTIVVGAEKTEIDIKLPDFPRK